MIVGPGAEPATAEMIEAAAAVCLPRSVLVLRIAQAARRPYTAAADSRERGGLMPQSVAVIHTSFVSLDDLKNLFREIVPEVTMINIVDDSLLAEVLASGRLTEAVTRRVCAYALQAEAMGVDAILNQCSSVGEAVDVARRMLRVPYVKIDEPMAEEAVRLGSTISVVATVPTTLEPSCRLVERAAERSGQRVTIRRALVHGAFDALTKERDREKHNRLVLAAVETAAAESDVIVLAQGSMIVLLPMLGHIKKPVLSSPRSGVQNVRKVLGL